MGAKYITKEERIKIETWLDSGFNVREIADKLGKSPLTIRREIKRGTVTLINTELMEYETYCWDAAQSRYDELKTKKGRNPKLAEDFALSSFLEKKIIDEKYSPYAALVDAKKSGQNFNVTICTKTLYNNISSGFFKHLSDKHLRIKRQKVKQKPKTEQIIKDSVRMHSNSIDDRPEEINRREILNHWEMDCIESGKEYSEALLVMTERISRISLVFKLKQKTVDEVINVLDQLEHELKYRFKKVFRSITMDNGSEFSNPELIERSLLTLKPRTITYFCHPHCPNERGSNEHVNRLIRYWVPKGCDIGKYSDAYIQHVQTWLNNYPRKLFNGQSALEVYQLLSH